MKTRFTVGFIIGWLSYIAVWIIKDFHGGLTVFIQPILAAIFSFIFSGLAFVLGLPIRKTNIRKIWNRLGYFSLFLTIVGMVCIFIPEKLGLTHEEIHPETGKAFQVINTLPLVFSYFFIIFPFVNWPELKKEQIR